MKFQVVVEKLEEDKFRSTSVLVNSMYSTGATQKLAMINFIKEYEVLVENVMNSTFEFIDKNGNLIA